MLIFRDGTGIYVKRTDGHREYIVPTLIEYSGEIVYKFDLVTRVLKAAIEPDSLTTLLNAQGWEPGKNVRLRDPRTPNFDDILLDFPVVKVVESITNERGRYLYRLGNESEIGLIPAIRRIVGGKQF